MYDLGVSYTFHFHKKNTESSVIFLRNDVLILNGKENKEATAICFEIRIPKKKNKELLRKVPSKIYGSNFIMEKNEKKIWFVNISEYHHRAMGLMSECLNTLRKIQKVMNLLHATRFVNLNRPCPDWGISGYFGKLVTL